VAAVEAGVAAVEAGHRRPVSTIRAADAGMLDTGSTIAGYRIEAVLGQGGMGVVYEATQQKLNRTVALKLLASHLSHDPAFRRRFEREGHVQARLDHPHIITVFEAGESEAGLFLAMQLVRGPTLKDLIVSRELDVGRALRIVTPIADAVDAAHAEGLIHRDIKPQNILVGGRDHAWLADFGLTKSSEQTAVTKSGQFVGTLDYISPEQITDQDATPRSDVYSLGGVLFESLVGSVPFAKKSEAAVIYAHLSLPPPRVTDHRPELPAALDEVIARAMAKEPGERYASATEMVRAAAQAFDPRFRAVLKAPAPIEAPEQVGVRQPENRVPTAERPRHEPSIPTAVIAKPRRLGRSVPALIAAGLAALGIGAFILAGSGSDADADGTVPASAGALSVRLPPDWRPLQGHVAIPGMTFRDSLSVGPGGDPARGMVAGTVEASGPKLLPRPFFEKAGTESPERVRLGELEALRYGPIEPARFGRTLTVYAIPTSRGAAALACFSRAPATAFLSQCERTASTARLEAGKAYPVRPTAEYAKRVSEVLAQVAGTRSLVGGELRRARTPPAQARAARRIATAYTRAGEAVRGIDAGPLAAARQEALARALTQTGAAYDDLAAAAQAERPDSYARARLAVKGAERRVRKAIRGLEDLGYKVAG
jgi:serine/threonine-protein kinase